jgi:hypothetical protein
MGSGQRLAGGGFGEAVARRMGRGLIVFIRVFSAVYENWLKSGRFGFRENQALFEIALFPGNHHGQKCRPHLPSRHSAACVWYRCRPTLTRMAMSSAAGSWPRLTSPARFPPCAGRVAGWQRFRSIPSCSNSRYRSAISSVFMLKSNACRRTSITVNVEVYAERNYAIRSRSK